MKLGKLHLIIIKKKKRHKILIFETGWVWAEKQ